eukprot:scaffold28528_cov24-Tisochrysis_lutea.AAC.4
MQGSRSPAGGIFASSSAASSSSTTANSSPAYSSSVSGASWDTCDSAVLAPVECDVPATPYDPRPASSATSGGIGPVASDGGPSHCLRGSSTVSEPSSVSESSSLTPPDSTPATAGRALTGDPGAPTADGLGAAAAPERATGELPCCVSMFIDPGAPGSPKLTSETPAVMPPYDKLAWFGSILCAAPACSASDTAGLHAPGVSLSSPVSACVACEVGRESAGRARAADGRPRRTWASGRMIWIGTLPMCTIIEGMTRYFTPGGMDLPCTLTALRAAAVRTIDTRSWPLDNVSTSAVKADGR